MIEKHWRSCVIGMGALLMAMAGASYGAETSDYTGDDFIFRKVDTGPIFVKCAKQGECDAASGVSAAPNDKIQVISDDGTGNLYVIKVGGRADGDAQYIQRNALYSASKPELVKTFYEHDGWTTGALTVPFKYFPSSRNITSTVSIGGFMGYTWEHIFTSQFTLTPVLSAGVTSITVESIQPNAAAGAANPTSANLTGVGWAVGGILTLDKRGGFQIGLVGGKDYVGANSAIPYKYEGNWWWGLAIGYQFIK